MKASTTKKNAFALVCFFALNFSASSCVITVVNGSSSGGPGVIWSWDAEVNYGTANQWTWAMDTVQSPSPGDSWGYYWTGGFNLTFLVNGVVVATTYCTGSGTYSGPRPTSYGTNYVLSATNTSLDRPMNVTWFSNGIVVLSTNIQPGQVASLSQSALVGDGNTNVFSMNTFQPVAGMNNPFASSTSSNSILANTGSNSMFASTSDTIWNSQSISNNLNWAGAGAGAGGNASESTLRAGVGQLHQDNLNNLSALGVLHADLQTLHTDNQTLTMVVTNQLGQLITLTMARTNNDSQFQLVNAVTNNGARVEAAIKSLESNQPQLTLSNYALESTLEALTNMLGQLASTNYPDSFTNDLKGTNLVSGYVFDPSDTNGSAAKAWAKTQLSDELSRGDAAKTVIQNTLGQNVPDGSPPDMRVSFGALCPVAGTIDLDPVKNFPWIFVFVKAFFTWVIVVTFVTGILKTIFDAIHDYAAAQTGHIPPSPNVINEA